MPVQPLRRAGFLVTESLRSKGITLDGLGAVATGIRWVRRRARRTTTRPAAAATMAELTISRVTDIGRRARNRGEGLRSGCETTLGCGRMQTFPEPRVRSLPPEIVLERTKQPPVARTLNQQMKKPLIPSPFHFNSSFCVSTRVYLKHRRLYELGLRVGFVAFAVLTELFPVPPAHQVSLGEPYRRQFPQPPGQRS